MVEVFYLETGYVADEESYAVASQPTVMTGWGCGRSMRLQIGQRDPRAGGAARRVSSGLPVLPEGGLAGGHVLSAGASRGLAGAGAGTL